MLRVKFSSAVPDALRVLTCPTFYVSTSRLFKELIILLRQVGHDVVAAAHASGLNTVTGEGLGDYVTALNY